MVAGRRFISIACAVVAIGWQAEHAHAQSELPLFDGHLHYSAGATQQYSLEKIIEILDRAGIHKALLSSTPNDGTVELYRRYPQRFIPELRPYRKTRDLASWSIERGTWYRDPATATFVENELAKGIYRGIGEFHLNGDEADTPVVRRIVELARERGLWLHAHCDAPALEKLFSVDSGARILWAHAGMSEPVATVGQMMARYPTLSADLSYRDVAPGGLLDAGWRALFETYPDRFMYGSDTWIPPRWEIIGEIAADARTWLRQLPDHIADRIMWGNAERLFGSSNPERHR